MSRCSKKILVTGATGLLGKAMLASPPLPVQERGVVALCHRSRLESGSVHPELKLEWVAGDLRAERMGVDSVSYQKLCTDVDLIVHMAAVTKFTTDNDLIHDTNTAGTRHVVQLARHSGARLVYVSTAFVWDQASELAPASGYEASKRAAEQLVSTLPDVTIVRPSIIVGDSKTGVAAAYQGLHHVAGSLMDGTLPVLPSIAGRLCDFVAQDWVADAVWGAALHPTNLGELWVTAGKTALRVEEIARLAVQLGQRLGYRPAPIKLVPYETVERLFFPVFLSSLPPRLRRQFRADLKLARYMNQVEPLPSSEAVLQRELGLPKREDLALVLERNLLRWAEDQRARAIPTTHRGTRRSEPQEQVGE
jgi:nucleoside-diphosphate-sugar epimerase